MQKIIMLDNEYATLWFYPDHKIIHHKFHKFIYGPEFRQILEKGLEVFKENGAQKWLSDDRNNSALPTADLDWSMNNWFHRAFDAGWKYWAIVMPDKIAGQLNMKRFIDTYSKQGLAIQIFDDPDEALNWLETVHKPQEQPITSN